MRLPPHYYDLRPSESESDALVAAAIERLSADPEYWEALAEAERAAEGVQVSLAKRRAAGCRAVELLPGDGRKKNPSNPLNL